MALNRRANRFQASIWPGFVDAMTALLLVLIFVLSIFMIVQSLLTETITGQESALDRLSTEIDSLAIALGTAQQRNADLEERVSGLGIELEDARTNEEFQARLIDALTEQVESRTQELQTAQSRITDFEDQVASLLAQRDTARQTITDLEQSAANLTDERDALETALAAAREEVDAEQEAARLAAAKADALESLAAELRSEITQKDERIAEVEQDLSEEETARLAEAAAAQALRDRLENADAELTAMTLSLEEERKQAEETLTLLAAANAARDDLDARLAVALTQAEQTRADLDQAQLSQDELREKLAAALAAQLEAETSAEDALSELEQRQALLAAANSELETVEAESAESQQRVTALNAQVAQLRQQMERLQGLLDDADTRDAQAQVRIETLGSQLNSALARAASEQRRRAELEEAERKRLEEEAKDLERYRSEFFGRLREIIGDQQGVRVVGDRFVFDSEVLFPSGSAQLSPAGRGEIANVARILQEVAAVIPPEIDWIVRVDGHTDDRPIGPGGEFSDNWELSQARALSVVREMIDSYGFPPSRLAAAGFGEYQPVNPAETADARAQNRRIELKLTER